MDVFYRVAEWRGGSDMRRQIQWFWAKGKEVNSSTGVISYIPVNRDGEEDRRDNEHRITPDDFVWESPAVMDEKYGHLVTST